MNRRIRKRQATMGLLLSMWDGESSCIGVVEDVSADGIMVSQIPSHFDEDSQECVTLVHTPLKDFKLSLAPCWRIETKNEMYQKVGFKIVAPISNWEQFVNETLEATGVY